MATPTTNKQILHHPSHPHPLELLDEWSDEKGYPTCRLCNRKIWSKDYYTCREGGCGTDIYSYHRVCVEAPPRIDRHPLHTEHPLILIHAIGNFTCDHCDQYFIEERSWFRCDECDFNLDTGCALSAIPDIGGFEGSEKITLPLHHHPLTLFSSRHEFVGNRYCYICWESVGGGWYTCLYGLCEFFIHKRCVQDLCFADETKAPTVYHGHQLEIHTRSRTCASCGSDKSDEFIGCGSCGVFYHRQCFQVPEIITYPIHSPDHRLVLSLDIGSPGNCESCSNSLKDQIYYRCAPCDYLVHIECAMKVLGYVEEGMNDIIELPWHKHPLFLCHGTESSWYTCNYCQDDLIGPTYKCKEEGCVFTLHKQCSSEVKSTITHHPHHPDHPLSLGQRDDDVSYDCQVCGRTDFGLKFSCERCLVDIHVQCAALFPNHKHYLHEHNLFRLESFREAKCNRCDKSTDSPLFRCVPCNFNLHEECMELPRVVKSKIHWHPVTLQSKFLEDDSGEYYCEECEQTRDPRLGVYVCGQCHISIPRIYHIHCVLPELAMVYEKHLDDVKERLLSDLKQLDEEIADQQEKLEEVTLKVDELLKQRTRVLNQVQNLCNPSI